MALIPRILLCAFFDVGLHFLYDFGIENLAEVDFLFVDEWSMELVFPTSIQIVISVTETLNVVGYELFPWVSFKNRTLQEQFNGVKCKVQHDRATGVIGFPGRLFQDCAQT